MALVKVTFHLELNPGPDQVYTVTSPDIPGLVTEGSTSEEIARNVQDAINGLIDVYTQQGWALPPALQQTTQETAIEMPLLVAA